MSLYQTTIRLTHHVRDARAIHRAICHDTHPERVLWAQPEPRTLILRASRHHTWDGFPHAARTTTVLVPDRYETGQPVTWALIANPTTTVHAGNNPDGTPAGRGKRAPIMDPGHAAVWAVRHLAPALDAVVAGCERIQPARGGDRLLLTRWAYTGTGTVADPDALRAALAEGVGRGRAFGCGMLLLGGDGA